MIFLPLPQGERKREQTRRQLKITRHLVKLHATPSNGLKAAREPATFFLMKTNEKDMETDIKKLALAHAEAAIQVLADVMNNPDAPAGARISAAKALLDRGFGKVTTQKPEEEEAR